MSWPARHERASVFDARRKAQVLWSAIFQQLPMLVSVACGFILVPFIVHRIGMEAYGLWVFALAVLNFLTCAEGALYWTCVLRVGRPDQAQVPGSLNYLALLFLLIGSAGLLVLACTGYVVMHSTRFPAEQQASVPVAFCWLGVSFLSERFVILGTAALAGMRKFGLSNTISVLVVVARTILVFVLLANHATLPVLTASYAIVNVLATVAFLTLLFHVRLISWKERSVSEPLLSNASFTASSVVTNFAQLATVAGPSIVVGLMSGPAMSAVLSFGQKPALLVSSLLWKAAEPLFPEAVSAREQNYYDDILEFGSRWVPAFGFPCCLVLIILAPDVLRLWLGTAETDSVVILRLYSLGIMADCLGLAAFHLVLGKGEGWVAARSTLTQAVIAVAGTAVAAPLFGSRGIGLAFVAATTVFAAAALLGAASRSRHSLVSLLRHTASLVLAPMACLIAVLLIFTAVKLSPAARVMFGGAAAAAVYWIVLFLRTHAEEKRMFHSFFTQLWGGERSRHVEDRPFPRA